MNVKTIVLVLLVSLAANIAVADNTEVVPKPVSEFDLADYPNQVVLVDFWASWCAPCRQSLPWLNTMQKKYGAQGLRVVMVNLDKNAAAARKMAADIEPGIRQFLDPEGTLAAQYELEGMPSSYLYDRDGKLIASHLGFLKADGASREKAVVQALEKGEH